MARENPIQVEKMQRKLVTFIALSVYAADSAGAKENAKVLSLIGKLRDGSKTSQEDGSKLLIEQELSKDSVIHTSIKGDLNEGEDVFHTKGVHSLADTVEAKVSDLHETRIHSDDFKTVLNTFFKTQNLSDHNKHLGDIFGTSHGIRKVTDKSDKAEMAPRDIKYQNHHKLWGSLRSSIGLTRNDARENVIVHQEVESNAEVEAKNVGQEMAGNSKEYGKYYEGDMIVENDLGRSTVLQAKFWPNGVIPFDFDNQFPHEDRKTVLRVISYLNHVTCLHFRKHWFFLDGPSYVKITNRRPGCFATVGKPSKGAGKVNLSPSCLKKDGTIMHELLHSVGLFHEHSRYDRDQYVKISWENINPSDQHNFLMRNNFQVSNIPYDYYSIMHYSTHAYTKNGLPTLEPKKPVDLRIMGQRDFLTTWDLAKVKNLYCR